MEDTIKLIKYFEKRNNISIAVTFYSDGSSATEEFWDYDELNSSKTLKEFNDFIRNTNYKKGNDGRCLSPVEKV